MARSIVLRFDATCFDCGSSLPAGSTARWFGRGRVSCCGSGAPGPAAAPPLRPSVLDYANPADPTSIVHRAPLDGHQPIPAPAPRASGPTDETSLPPGLRNGPSAGFRAVGPNGLSPELERALLLGLSPAQLADVATAMPGLLLLVRLTSGARFMVPAGHARHVIDCIEESLRDRCRDVMRAAVGRDVALGG